MKNRIVPEKVDLRALAAVLFIAGVFIVTLIGCFIRIFC